MVTHRVLALVAIATSFLLALPALAQEEFKWTNTQAANCIDPLTAASISANLAALLAPPPSDLALSLVADAVDLVLKACGPVIDPVSRFFVEPNFPDSGNEKQCIYRDVVSPTQGESADVMGIRLFDLDDNWGSFETPRVRHFNTSVLVTLEVDGEQLPEGENDFAIGTHEITWRGDTLLAPVDLLLPFVSFVGKSKVAPALKKRFARETLRASGRTGRRLAQTTGNRLLRGLGKFALRFAISAGVQSDGNQPFIEENEALDFFLSGFPVGPTNFAEAEFAVLDLDRPSFRETGGELLPPQLITIEGDEPGGASRTRGLPQVRQTFELFDDCGRSELVDLVPGSVPPFWPIGEPITINWVATDRGPNERGIGNTEEFTQIITVVDTTPPVLLAPEDRVVISAAPLAVATQTAASFDTVDLNLDVRPLVRCDQLAQPTLPELACNEVTGIELCELPDGHLFADDLRTQVTWVATDFSGNCASTTQMVSVKDSNGPPSADNQLVPDAVSFESIEILLTGNDPDPAVNDDAGNPIADPLRFRISETPANGFFVAPLLPYFVGDFRLDAQEDSLARCAICVDQGINANECLRRDVLVEPEYVAIQDDGTSYVLDRTNRCDYFQTPPQVISGQRRIVKFDTFDVFEDEDSFGVVLAEVVRTASEPSLFIEPNGFVSYLTTSAGGPWFIVRLDADLVPQQSVRLSNNLGGDGGVTPLTQPKSYAFDSQGVLYVVDGTRLVALNANQLAGNGTPEFLGEIVSQSDQLLNNGRFDMAIDSEDNLYMSEANGDRVYKFGAAELRLEASGEVRSFVPGSLVGWAGSCTFGSGCDSVNQRAFGYTCTDGGPGFCRREEVFTAGAGPGQFDEPRGIGIGAGDILYVTDFNNERVVRFTPEGHFAGEARSADSDDLSFVLGDFGMPEDIAVNSNNFFVLERDEDRLHTFDTSAITPVDGSSATVVYQSNNNFAGTDAFEFVASDGLMESAPANVQVEVERNQRPPVARPDSWEGVEDVSIAIVLAGNDPDRDCAEHLPNPDDPVCDDLVFTITTAPEKGQLIGTARDRTYIPDPDASGADRFEYIIDDGTLQSPPTEVLISLTPLDDEPVVELVAGPGSVEPAPGTPIQVGRGFDFTLVGSYVDPDGNALFQAGSIADPAAGTHFASIDWGDGCVEPERAPETSGSVACGARGPLVVPLAAGAGMAVSSHVYTQNGMRTATLCVEDNVELANGTKRLPSASTPSCTSVEIEVLDSVDVAVRAGSASVLEGGQVLQSFEVINQLPLVGSGQDATGVTATIVLPGAATVVFAQSSSGPCTFTERVVTCELGTVAAGEINGASIDVVLSVHSGLAAGSPISIEMSADSDQADLIVNNATIGIVEITSSLADSDFDGVVDPLDNCVRVANPFQADPDDDGIGSACDFDDDGDGMSDLAEIGFGLDPDSAADADEDFDEDSYPNREEVAAGASPVNDERRPALSPGEILVGEHRDHRIIRINPDTGEQRILAQGGLGGPSAGIEIPVGLALGPNREIFTLDAKNQPNDYTLYSVSAETGIQSLIRVSSDPLQGSLAIRSDGSLYFTNSFFSQVVRFDPFTGDFSQLASVVDPQGIAFDPQGRLFVTLRSPGQLLELDPDSGQITVVASGLVHPTSLGIDSVGRLLVEDGPNAVRRIEVGVSSETLSGGLLIPLGFSSSSIEAIGADAGDRLVSVIRRAGNSGNSHSVIRRDADTLAESTISENGLLQDLAVSLVIVRSLCSDGFDNDDDGFVDFPDDPQCGSARDDSEENLPFACDDGLDNDGDSRVDFPDDPDCESASDPFERNLDLDGAPKVTAANVQFTNPLRFGGFDFTSVPQQSAPGVVVPGAITELAMPGLRGLQLSVGGTGLDHRDGILMASLRQGLRTVPFSGGLTRHGSVEVSRNAFGDGFLSLQITDASLSGLNPARYDPAVAWFPFAAGWRGAHIDGDGTLAIANGVTQDMIERVEPESGLVGRFHLNLGVNARSDGMLFAIGASPEGDRVVSTSVLSDESAWDVRVFDNEMTFSASGVESPFSLLYLPYDTPGLIGGNYDGLIDRDAPGTGLLASAGNFSLDRVGAGVYRLSIPGESPETGMLLLTVNRVGNLGGNPEAPDDNVLSYEADGQGGFLIRHWQIGLTDERDSGFVFAFVKFDAPLGNGDPDFDGIGSDGDDSGVIGDAPCTGGNASGCDDNCAFAANPSQTDTDGDGIGDGCECGDANGDGELTEADSDRVLACTLGTAECTGFCDVTGEGVCNTTDMRLIQRFDRGAIDKSAFACRERP